MIASRHFYGEKYVITFCFSKVRSFFFFIPAYNTYLTPTQSWFFFQKKKSLMMIFPKLQWFESTHKKSPALWMGDVLKSREQNPNRQAVELQARAANARWTLWMGSVWRGGWGSRDATSASAWPPSSQIFRVLSLNAVSTHPLLSTLLLLNTSFSSAVTYGEFPTTHLIESCRAEAKFYLVCISMED